jgi:hypothetical protein
MNYHKNSHCSYCGAKFGIPAVFPATCVQCGKASYLNPLPVGVVLIPVENKDKSLLCVIRNIEPGKGGLALPGGYLELNESWQEGAIREVFEETGIRLKSDSLRLYDVISVPDAVLIFSVADPVSLREIASFKANPEIAGIKIIKTAEQMTFSSHSEVVKKYFKE